MRDADTVGVLMPVRAHRPEYLAEAIGSLFRQTSGAWRLNLIAEAKDVSDLRAELSDALADPRVTVIANEGRKLAGALNTGMRHARSRFVALLFADDLWAPDAVNVLQTNMTADPKADFFHSSRRIVDEHGHPISDVFPARLEVRLEDFWRLSPVKHLLCWRRDMGLAVGGIDETLDSVGPDDLDFPWTMAECGARFVAVPECLYIYRDHRSCFRLTTDLPRKVHERELRRILLKHAVPEEVIRARIVEARASYLRQCLYANSLQARVRRALGLKPARVWRESYR